jgi:hypothetical protein
LSGYRLRAPGQCAVLPSAVPVALFRTRPARLGGQSDPAFNPTAQATANALPAPREIYGSRDMAGTDLPLPRCDDQLAFRALDRLRAAHPRASVVADALERAVLDRNVPEGVFVQHSRWCSTADGATPRDSWSAGVDPARDAAFAIYGFVPDRLASGDGACSRHAWFRDRPRVRGHVRSDPHPTSPSGAARD